MPRGSRDREAALAALKTAAREALIEVGYAGATARDIARRAECAQGLIFYYFGTVDDLLLAVLDEVSARRFAAYRPLLDQAQSLADLADAAGDIMAADLEGGDLAVLVALMTGARSTPGLAEQVTMRLEPWREFARDAVRKASAWVPFGALLPVEEIADLVVGSILGLELLSHTTGDPGAARRVVDRAAGLSGLLAGSLGGAR